MPAPAVVTDAALLHCAPLGHPKVTAKKLFHHFGCTAFLQSRKPRVPRQDAAPLVLFLGQGSPRCYFPEPIISPEPVEGSRSCQQSPHLLAHRQSLLSQGHSPWVGISKASGLSPHFILSCSSTSAQGSCPTCSHPQAMHQLCQPSCAADPRRHANPPPAPLLPAC